MYIANQQETLACPLRRSGNISSETDIRLLWSRNRYGTGKL